MRFFFFHQAKDAEILPQYRSEPQKVVLEKGNVHEDGRKLNGQADDLYKSVGIIPEDLNVKVAFIKLEYRLALQMEWRYNKRLMTGTKKRGRGGTRLDSVLLLPALVNKSRRLNRTV